MSTYKNGYNFFKYLSKLGCSDHFSFIVRPLFRRSLHDTANFYLLSLLLGNYWIEFYQTAHTDVPNLNSNRYGPTSKITMSFIYIKKEMNLPTRVLNQSRPR